MLRDAAREPYPKDRASKRPIACLRQAEQDASSVPARAACNQTTQCGFARHALSRQGSKRMVSVFPSGRAPPILLPEGRRKRADALVQQGRRSHHHHRDTAAHDRGCRKLPYLIRASDNTGQLVCCLTSPRWHTRSREERQHGPMYTPGTPCSAFA